MPRIGRAPDAHGEEKIAAPSAPPLTSAGQGAGAPPSRGRAVIRDGRCRGDRAMIDKAISELHRAHYQADISSPAWP